LVTMLNKSHLDKPVVGGGGTGDMLKAVYDPNDDGVIALAQLDPLVCSESEADTKVNACMILNLAFSWMGI